MSLLRPFRAWRPRKDLAPRVAAPPYDVMNSSEARKMAEGNEFSFLHISKAEIDFEPGTSADDPRVYARARENFEGLIRRGAIIREAGPAFYIYRQKMGDHIQTGVVAGASIDEYEDGRIKKHEHTRRDKEDDRTRHVNAMNANTGPVFLTYLARPEIDRLVAEFSSGAPEYDFVSDDGIVHTLWVVSAPEKVEALKTAFQAVPALYVADGHHRSAAATRVRAERRAANPHHRGDEPYNFFLSVIFPHDQMMIMAYNRVVRDLNGNSPKAFLQKVGERFEIAPAAQAAPDRAKSFGMYLENRWHALTARPGSFPADDPVARLDCAILQENLLHPVLGIQDPRTDKRIDFVGGIRGTAELERRCREGWAVAFALYPTGIDQLISVADAGKVMPPKSTWFEPKLRSGLIVRPLED
ncbi:MAG: DUF1015 domain-containing protein [Candidatus Eisenbacteria bacterium]|nr:DUF1015 domain-containing protein [Candidatus Eisenbacteria bacterium]